VILRDPVHGLVSFEGEAERVVTALLGTREVQRLRRVRQLGLTSLVFPGAEHSRFAHAVGATHVMVRLLERVRAGQDGVPPEARVDDEAARDALAATLLHDLGHGPFSHLFEEVMPGARSHEAWTADAIRDPSTDVYRALASLDPAMPERVVALLGGRYRIGWLGRAVSGTIDVDRCDYLLRDSHMTGARYGLYDLDWLLQAFRLDRTARGDVVLAVEGRKGLPPIEGFFLGRHFMYRQVYHHKATRAAEQLIRAIFVRVAELVREGAAPEGVPAALASAARGQDVSLGDYLALDDAELHHCFAAWATRATDATLRDLATRVQDRRLPKTVPLPADDASADLRETARARAAEVVAAMGMRADLGVFVDVTCDTPYAEPDDDSPEGVFVSIRHQPMKRLGACSFVLGELRNKTFAEARLVFPAEARERVLAALEGVFA
jgi:HD superfamily phosphohydrolase